MYYQICVRVLPLFHTGHPRQGKIMRTESSSPRTETRLGIYIIFKKRARGKAKSDSYGNFYDVSLSDEEIVQIKRSGSNKNAISILDDIIRKRKSNKKYVLPSETLKFSEYDILGIHQFSGKNLFGLGSIGFYKPKQGN